MRRHSKCDLRGGWPECWNTECRWHGKAAKRWHELNSLLRDRGDPALLRERNEVYQRLTVEPPRRRA